MRLHNRQKRPVRYDPTGGGPDAEPRPTIPLPADIYIDKDAEAAGQHQLKHWLDEKYEEFVQSGGWDRLPGRGKPVSIPTGDVMTTILKNANVPHPWVLLRLTIQESIEETMHLLRRSPEDPLIEEQLLDINKRIIQYNHESPSLTLHRRKITRENIEREFERWK
jgi:hypothetical protein